MTGLQEIKANSWSASFKASNYKLPILTITSLEWGQGNLSFRDFEIPSHHPLTMHSDQIFPQLVLHSCRLD